MPCNARKGRAILTHRNLMILACVMAITKVVELVRQSYSGVEAAAYEAFVADDGALRQLGLEGREVLKHFPYLPGACAVMGALLAVILQEKNKSVLLHVAAGMLAVEGRPVFGSPSGEVDWNSAFGNSNSSWDGHCWIVCGDWNADISVCRTAYSRGSPPALASFIRREFGEGRGMLITRADGELQYEPQYILTEAQINGLARGAMHLLDQSLRKNRSSKG